MKKRFIVFMLVVSLFFCGIIGRTGYIVFSGDYTVNEGRNSYKLVIDSLEPYLYYSDGSTMTNNKTSYAIVLRPNEKTAMQLYELFSFEERKEINEELKKGKPIIKTLNKYKSTSYLKPYKVTESSYTAFQLLSKQSSGLLTYLPDSVGKLSIAFALDARGRLLSGDEGRVIRERYDTLEGANLTLDHEIQKIAYNASVSINSGCVIVMDVETSSILACVTKPDNSYLNKAIQPYSVGSVFKIIVAASALENNLNIEYKCKGKIKVGDTVFSCQKGHIHKKQNLKQALANSCNCYFVNLALQLRAGNLLETAKKFGIDSETKLYKDFGFKNGSLPSETELKSSGELALLGFGQGKVLITPLHFCNIMCAVADSGKSKGTKLVRGTVNKTGVEKTLEYPKPKQTISNTTSNELLSYLRFVASNGTAKAADYKGLTAGKTATAQTGKYDVYNNEILNTWFAGVYPYDNPKYAIVVMVENGKSGAESCCPVFRTIVEKLDKR